MRNKLLFSSILLAASVSLSAQQSATITLHADQGKQIIPKEIYGQFAEHLGTCIYGGLWVGENSDIPNIKGYRTDVFNALKDLQVPVLRWPGGCFADEYHWMDGIGCCTTPTCCRRERWVTWRTSCPSMRMLPSVTS